MYGIFLSLVATLVTPWHNGVYNPHPMDLGISVTIEALTVFRQAWSDLLNRRDQILDGLRGIPTGHY